MSYTKGPWNKNEDGRLVNDEGRIVTAWGISVGAVYKTEESEANAHLIAAAPDLLEALELLIALPIAVKDLQYLDKRIGTATENKAWLIARAAISKAKGENAMTYRERPEANFSNLKHLVNGTALDYHHALQNPLVPSRAMEIGTLIHAVYLEGAELDSLIALIPDDAPKKPDKKQLNAKRPSDDTKKAIAWWDEFNATVKGRIILDSEEKQSITDSVKSLEGNQWLNRFMKYVGDQVETAIYGTIEGVACKGLIDALSLNPLCVGDLKCLHEVGPREFSRAVNDRHYDLQYALYCELMIQSGMCDVIPPWVWICQQTDQPHNLALYASPEWFDNGRRKLTLCLDKLKRAQDSGQWESFPVEPISLEMPRWAAVKE